MLKRLVAITAAVTLACACFSGCQNAEKADNGNAVTLKWVFLGPGEQRDSQEVWKAFNEKLSELIPDTAVKFECIPSAEYSEKWKLMSTSQEKVDIVWHGWMIPYVAEVKKGSYIELDGLIEEYAPEILQEIPEAMLAKQRVDGKLYSIPNIQQMVSYVQTLDFPIDIYEKYKDRINVDELHALFSSHETMDAELWDKLEEFIVMLKEGGDLRQGVLGFENHVEKGYEWIMNPYKVREYDQNPKVTNIYRTEEFKTFVQVISDWYQKGYVRKDILTADNLTAGRKEGQYSMMGSGNFLIGQDMIPSPEEIERNRLLGQTETVKIPFYNEHYIPSEPSSTNTAISVNSANPERAMQLIRLMHTAQGAELYNLLVYGLEDKHYKKINDLEIEPIGYASQPTSDSPYGLYKWAIGNTYYAHEIYMENKNKLYTNEFIKQVNEAANPSVLQGFSLDIEPIKIELSQINAVKGEFIKPLNSGAAQNAMQLYDEFVTKLIRAGDDKVTAEIQRQIDEWMAKGR